MKYGPTTSYVLYNLFTDGHPEFSEIVYPKLHRHLYSPKEVAARLLTALTTLVPIFVTEKQAILFVPQTKSFVVLNLQ